MKRTQNKEEIKMWIYIQTEPSLWTVGFYSPDRKWHPESDWGTPEEAAIRGRYLNGGKDAS